MPSYSKARLEGLAFEAWLRYLSAGGDGPEPTTLLVKLGKGRFDERGAAWDDRVPAALRAVEPRARAVVRGLEAEGIELRGATCLVRHRPGGRERTSVDVRIRSWRRGATQRRRGRGQRGLLEAKWSRFRLTKARRAARTKLPVLRAIRKTGRWCGPAPARGKRACAPLVGTLIACRGAWELQLYREASHRARRCNRIRGRIQVRLSGAARRKRAAAKAAAQQQVPALGGPGGGAWSETGSGEEEEMASSQPSDESEESSDSTASSDDSHDGYSTDSD